MAKARPLLRVETWLREGKLTRRAASGKNMPFEGFEEQRRPDTEYIIFERVVGTYSDNRAGSRPAYERIE